MRVCLTAVNSKYIHENLAVHSLRAFACRKAGCTGKAAENERSDDAAGIGETPKAAETEVSVPGGVYCSIQEFTINQTHEYVLGKLYKENADIYAFSVYIWNVTFVMRIADELLRIRPDAHIWMGGPEVSYDAEEVLKKHSSVTGIMRGEGEETFAELIGAYAAACGAQTCDVIDAEHGRDAAQDNDAAWDRDAAQDNDAAEDHDAAQDNDAAEDRDAAQDNDAAEDHDAARYCGRLTGFLRYIPGITYRDENGSIISTASRPPMDMDDLVFPYEGTEFDPTRIYYYESSRGCPYNCSYCLSSIDKSVRYRSTDTVKKEIAYFLSKNIRQVKFVDRTFNCNPKRSRELWKYIKDNDNGRTNFHFEISADLLENEDIELLAQLRPGQVQLEIGVQTTNPGTLEAINRKTDFNKLADRVRRLIHTHNIHIHLDLIAGLPYEDISGFRKSFNDVYGLKPLQLQLGFLKVLKGTAMEQDVPGYGAEYLYSPYPPYEVLGTPWMDYGQLEMLKGISQMLEQFYNSRQFEHAMEHLESKFDDYFELYKRLSEFYRNNHYDEVKHARIKLYEILLKFVDECGADREEFVPLLLKDAYAREKLKHFPEWAAGYEHTVCYDYERRDPLTYNAMPAAGTED